MATNIPLKNTRFSGRADVIETLERELVSKSTSRPTFAIVGPGGIGKTQVLLEFAHRAEANPQCYNVYWVSASSDADFEKTYTDIGRRVGFKLENVDGDPKETVLRYLESLDRKWVLLLDGADEKDAFFGSSDIPEGIIKYLPLSPKCQIFLTTRSREIATAVARGNIIDLAGMKDSDAKDLLVAWLASKPAGDNEAIAKDIANELGNIPLAIAQAVSYINTTQIPLKTYLDLLRGTPQDVASLLGRKFHDEAARPGSETSVVETWSRSFNQISKYHPRAAELLHFISCIKPTGIPRSMLPQFETREETEHAIGVLCGYAFLVRQENDILEMHRLVYAAVQSWIQSAGLRGAVQIKALLRLASIFPSDDEKNREVWRAYMPHTLHVLTKFTGNREVTRDKKIKLAECVGKCLRAEERIKAAGASSVCIRTFDRQEYREEKKSDTASISINTDGVDLLTQEHDIESEAVRFSDSELQDWQVFDDYTLDPDKINSADLFFGLLSTFITRIIAPLAPLALQAGGKGLETKHKRTKVAILDTGIDRTDAFIRGAFSRGRVKDTRNWIPGKNGKLNESDIADLSGHGTHVAALLLKVAPLVDISVARVSNGRLAVNGEIAIAEAIIWATETCDADIIVMPFTLPKWNHIVDEAIMKAHFRRKIILAATGNDGNNRGIAFPASDGHVIGVFSSDGYGVPSPFTVPQPSSNKYFMTLGEAVESSWPKFVDKNGVKQSRMRKSGSSIATAIAAGFVANVLDYAKWAMDLEPLLMNRLRSHDGMLLVLDLMTNLDRADGYRYLTPWCLWNPDSISDERSEEEKEFVDSSIRRALQ